MDFWNPRRLQAWLLRISGTVEICAFFAVIMPRSWMETAHAWLGLGTMPRGAVVDFMIRQAAFTYGLHGLLMWLLAMDVVRYRPPVVFTGVSYVVCGPVFFLIEWTAGTPWWWSVGDSASCLALGVAILGLDWWERKTR